MFFSNSAKNGMGFIELPVPMRNKPTLIGNVFRIVETDGSATRVSGNITVYDPRCTIVVINFTCNTDGMPAPSAVMLDLHSYESKPSGLELNSMLIFDANL